MSRYSTINGPIGYWEKTPANERRQNVTKAVPKLEYLDRYLRIKEELSGMGVRVVYVPDLKPDCVFVITAYEIGPKARLALMRRPRRNP